MGNHISWLHLLIHSYSQLVFRCWSTQDNCPCCSLCFTARSFSCEVLFFDYVACSHIKYSAALLLPWAWKKTPRSHTPLSRYTSMIFSLFPIHDSHVEIWSSALFPRPYIETFWPSFPKPIVGRGGGVALSSILRTGKALIRDPSIYSLLMFSFLLEIFI